MFTPALQPPRLCIRCAGFGTTRDTTFGNLRGNFLDLRRPTLYYVTKSRVSSSHLSFLFIFYLSFLSSANTPPPYLIGIKKRLTWPQVYSVLLTTVLDMVSCLHERCYEIEK